MEWVVFIGIAAIVIWGLLDGSIGIFGASISKAENSNLYWAQMGVLAAADAALLIFIVGGYF